MSNDKTKLSQIGWFIGTGLNSKLHGYGKIEAEKGLYENGKMMENINKIKSYDAEIDIIALEVLFEKYT